MVEQIVIGTGALVGIVGVLKVVAVGVVRSAAGYINNGLEDGKWDRYDTGKLFGTVIRTAVLTGALYFGIEGIFGTDMSILAAGAGAFITDVVVKKIGNKNIPTAPSKK